MLSCFPWAGNLGRSPSSRPCCRYRSGWLGHAGVFPSLQVGCFPGAWLALRFPWGLLCGPGMSGIPSVYMLCWWPLLQHKSWRSCSAVLFLRCGSEFMLSVPVSGPKVPVLLMYHVLNSSRSPSWALSAGALTSCHQTPAVTVLPVPKMCCREQGAAAQMTGSGVIKRSWSVEVQSCT